MHSAKTLGRWRGDALDNAAAEAKHHPLIVMDTHQAKAIRRIRTPIVVRPEPDVSVIVGFPFRDTRRARRGRHPR